MLFGERHSILLRRGVDRATWRETGGHLEEEELFAAGNKVIAAGGCLVEFSQVVELGSC